MKRTFISELAPMFHCVSEGKEEMFLPSRFHVTALTVGEDDNAISPIFLH